jgi:preprotein translocase subunit SecE
MWKEFKQYLKENHFSVFSFVVLIAAALYVAGFVIVGLIKKFCE